MRTDFGKSKIYHAVLQNEIVNQEINKPVKHQVCTACHTISKELYGNIFSERRIKKINALSNSNSNYCKNLFHANLEATKKVIEDQMLSIN
ncbi:MAG: hypothetical protein RIT43_2127 [Bacteroidota bacterium]